MDPNPYKDFLMQIPNPLIAIVRRAWPLKKSDPRFMIWAMDAGAVAACNSVLA